MQYFILFITLLISTNSWGINTPVNMSPSNGALNRPTTMAIDWTNITGNTGYLYELDTTPNFNSSVYVVGNTWLECNVEWFVIWNNLLLAGSDKGTCRYVCLWNYVEFYHPRQCDEYVPFQWGNESFYNNDDRLVFDDGEQWLSLWTRYESNV